MPSGRGSRYDHRNSVIYYTDKWNVTVNIMIIKLENIGPVADAKIDIGQITVIVGKNNVGKSFILKSIYSAFKALEMEEILLDEEIFRLKMLCRKYVRFILHSVKERTEIDTDVELILSLTEEIYNAKDKEIIIELLDDLITKTNNLNEKLLKDSSSILRRFTRISKELIVELNKIKENINSLENFEYRIKKAWKILINDIFSGKLKKVNAEIGKISANFEDVIISFSFDGDISIHTSEEFDKSRNFLKPIFIESPILLEIRPFLASSYTYRRIKSREIPIHIGSFFEYVETTARMNEYDDELFEELREIIKGEVYYDDEKGKFYYVSEDYDTPFDVQNVASGIKAFGILQLILKSGALENAIYFWEEPESHMHPEWQIKFAEVLAKIVKKGDNYVVLSSHSPFMVEILRVVAKENDINAKFYYLDETGKTTEINDENWEIISNSLLRPLRHISFRLFRVM
jgi:predicted ATPase